jgi:DNA replication protein DnaC
LILAGNVGTGKGHLAVSIAKAAINNGYSALFTSVSEVSNKINLAGFGKEPMIHNYIKPNLLILDEVTHGLNTITQNNLFDVLNGRALQVKSTIVITNLSMEELKTRLGERIIDRLRDHGSSALFFTWESGRK